MQIEELIKALDSIEEALKSLKLWGGEDNAPEESAFNSSMPFFMDTMEFHQWLEYYFLVQMRAMSKQGKIPHFSIAPMAEEVYRGQWDVYRPLIKSLRELDALVAHLKNLE